MADQTRAEVWISDDGELADVRKLLDRLDVAYASVPRTGGGGGDPDEDTGPVPAPDLSCSLLFTSPPSAVTLQPTILRSGALHVVVIDEVSRTLRRMLERHGYQKVEADVRARTIYLVQIGYISMQVHESLETRMLRIPTYARIYSGTEPGPAELKRFYARYKYTPVNDE